MDTNTRALLNLQSMEFPQRQPPHRGAANQTRMRMVRKDIAIQVLREYETRKRRYGSTSLVPIRQDACTGCQVAVSLRTRLRARSKITECEHCARLLYSPMRKHRPVRIEVPVV